jgi:protein-S-isoprenylcysteine O-methyltransferase Ste14
MMDKPERWIKILINLFLSALVIALVALSLRLDTLWPFTLPSALQPLFWPLFLIGSYLIAWAAWTLARHSGATGAPADPTHMLVTVGPYRWLRNPICLGDILLLFGLACTLRSPTTLLIAILSIPAFHLLVCTIEEPRTERRLGEPYRHYKHRVPRWIPKLHQ